MLCGYPQRTNQQLWLTHLRSRFPFMELGRMLPARRAPATEGKEAAQGATRRDRNPHSAPRRGGDGFSSATALRKLSSGRAAVGRQRATRREEEAWGEKRRAPCGTCVARGRLRSQCPSTTAAPPPTSPGAAPGSLLASVPLPGLSPDIQASPLRPNRADATSVRARPARRTQGRCRGAGAEPGRGLGRARWGAANGRELGGACPPAALRPALRPAVPAGDNPEGLDSSRHLGAGQCLPEARSRRAAKLTWTGAFVKRGWSEVQDQDLQLWRPWANLVLGRGPLLLEALPPRPVGTDPRTSSSAGGQVTTSS